MAPLAHIATTETGGSDAGLVTFLHTDAFGSLRTAPNTDGSELLRLDDDTHGYPIRTTRNTTTSQLGCTDPTGLDYHDKASDTGGGVAESVTWDTVLGIPDMDMSMTPIGQYQRNADFIHRVPECGLRDAFNLHVNPEYGLVADMGDSINAYNARCRGASATTQWKPQALSGQQPPHEEHSAQQHIEHPPCAAPHKALRGRR